MAADKPKTQVYFLNKAFFWLFNNSKEWKHSEDLSKILPERETTLIGVLEKLCDEGLCLKNKRVRADNWEYYVYTISIDGWDFINTLPPEQKDIPYSIWVVKKKAKEAEERIQKDLENRKMKIDTKNSERVYNSYNLTRFIAWASLIVSLITIILKITESRHK